MSDTIRELARRNNERDQPPVAIAPVSPFHEVLIRDVAESLPPELRNRVETASTVSGVNDWIAVGAMFRWLDDPHWRTLFLRHLDGDPRRAALTLVRTMSEPPPRTPEWHRADLLGALLQVAVAGLVLAARAAVVGSLALVRSWSAPPVFAVSFWLEGVLDLPMILGPVDGGVSVSILVCAALWHVAELVCGPALFERVRQWPARQLRVSAPTAGRLDTFNVAWCLQAALLWTALLLRAVPYLYRVLYLNRTVTATGDTAAVKVLVVVVSLFLLATIPILVASLNGLKEPGSERETGRAEEC